MWYRNLLDHPEVDVQVGPERFPARARTATPGEKPALWTVMTAVWPAYDTYEARSGRRIKVFALDRA